jgi:hypothetical protein
VAPVSAADEVAGAVTEVGATDAVEGGGADAKGTVAIMAAAAASWAV